MAWTDTSSAVSNVRYTRLPVMTGGVKDPAASASSAGAPRGVQQDTPMPLPEQVRPGGDRGASRASRTLTPLAGARAQPAAAQALEKPSLFARVGKAAMAFAGGLKFALGAVFGGILGALGGGCTWGVGLAAQTICFPPLILPAFILGAAAGLLVGLPLGMVHGAAATSAKDFFLGSPMVVYDTFHGDASTPAAAAPDEAAAHA
jgi:hypothetical protein